MSGAAGYLYDAMMLYALTADSMIRQGLDPRDGRAFSKHVQTISFRGKSRAGRDQSVASERHLKEYLLEAKRILVHALDAFKAE